MMHRTISKATLAGIGVLILAQALYIGVLVKITHHELLRLLLLIAPSLAAFIAAYLAPRRKLLVGLSMALYGAVIGVLSAFWYESFGLHVDRIGGVWATFLILLVYYLALSLVGGAGGYFLSRNKGLNNKDGPPE